MAQRRVVLNSLVALVAVLLTSAVAAVAVVGDLPSERAAEAAATIEFDGQGSVRIDPDGVTPSLAPLDTASVSTVAPAPTVTAPSAPETTLPPAPPTPPPTWGPGNMPVLPPPPVTPPPPPVVPVVDPSSWSLVENGITLTASIQPALPRVGDTVTISYTAAAAVDFCCWSHVFVDGVAVDEHLFPPGDECSTASHGSWTTTVVVDEPGPFTFQVQGNSMEKLCSGPPMFFNANLFATFDVRPAA